MTPRGRGQGCRSHRDSSGVDVVKSSAGVAAVVPRIMPGSLRDGPAECKPDTEAAYIAYLLVPEPNQEQIAKKRWLSNE